MSMLFLAKLTLAPGIVAGGSVAGRRWGHRVGGLVAGFPNTSSPILLFLAYEHSAAFAAAAATSVLLGLMALAAYGLAYTWAARRWPWGPSLALGWAAFLLAACGLSRVHAGPLAAAGLAVLGLALAMACMPRIPQAAAPPRGGKRDLALRMAAAIVLLTGITAAAGWLGPGLSGLLSAFPIASSVLTASAHREAGAGGAVLVLKGIFTALLALVLFTAALALLLPLCSVALAFCLAALLGFGAQVALIAWRRDLPSFAA